MNNTPSGKKQRFVDEYMIDRNATRAAIRAGFSAKTAGQAGSRLLKNVKVAEEIAKRQEKLATKLAVTKDMIADELRKIGFADIRKAVSWRGHLVREEDNPDGGDVLVIKEIVTNHVTLIDSDRLDDETAAAIAEVSQNATGGVKLKMHDKKGALVDLAKMLGYYVEKHDVSTDMKISFETVYEPKPD